jgi:hypothetical protein
MQDKIADKKFIAEELYRLSVMFPHETVDFFMNLTNRVIDYKFTEKELVEAVNRVIDSETRLTAASVLKLKYEQREAKRASIVD